MAPLSFRPDLYTPGTDSEALDALRDGGRVWESRDLVPEQLEELLDARLVGSRNTADARQALRNELLGGSSLESFGVWVHYPWSGVLVRVLPHLLFRELRLDRNRDKITTEELARLRTMRVGIVGLSVGNAVATTIAQEGVAGTLLLADFDSLGTSNLNRVRAAVHDVGLPKTVVAARQIAEIDPFIQVNCFPGGLTPDNLPSFLDALDVVVDECDGLAMKLRLRLAARSRRLPVVMETSDRGTLDIERFDLEPDRPILHGWVEHIDPDAIEALSKGERLAVIAQIVGYDVSTRAAASMLEIDASLSTWPQLASDVALGGATVCAAVRRILLDQPLPSGRRFIDAEARLDIIEPDRRVAPVEPTPPRPVQPVSALHRSLVEAAVQAPSGGNCQPWQFHCGADHIVVHHDRARSESLLDVDGLAGLVTIGMAIEAMAIEATAHDHQLQVEWTGASEGPVAILTLIPGAAPDALQPWIRKRFTDRRLPPREPLTPAALHAIAGCLRDPTQLQITTEAQPMAELGRWIGAVDRVRFLHPDLHREMWDEVRWSEEEAAAQPDGISLAEMAVQGGDEPVLRLLRRPDVAAFLRAQERGSRLGELAQKWVRSASAVGLFSCPDPTPTRVLESGRDIYRAWLTACAHGYAIQPIGVAAYMVRHLGTPLQQGYTTDDLDTLRHADQALQRNFSKSACNERLLLFRILRGGERYAAQHRRPIDDVLYVT